MPPEDSPRKTKTYSSFSGMNSQDERYGCQDDEFFWLENIMRVGDDKLMSISGPSLVAVITVPPPSALLLEETPAPYFLNESGGKLLLE